MAQENFFTRYSHKALVCYKQYLILPSRTDEIKKMSAYVLDIFLTATSYLHLFTFVSLPLALRPASFLLHHVPVSQLSFLRTTAQIPSASRLAHTTASVESGSCTAGVHLFYSCAITFRCHVAHTTLQLLCSQFTVK